VTLAADRPALEADGRDVAVVTVCVLDAQNRIVPVAADEIAFELIGPGRIIGVGNGDPSSHEPDVYRAGAPGANGAKPSASPWKRRVFHGLAQVLVQSGRAAGTITLRASAPGLAPAVLNVKTR